MTPEKNRNQSNLWHRKLRVVKKGPPRQVLPATLKLIGTAISLNFQRTCTSFFVGDHWQGQGRSLRPATISGSPPPGPPTTPEPRPIRWTDQFADKSNWQLDRAHPKETGGGRRHPKAPEDGRPGFMPRRLSGRHTAQFRGAALRRPARRRRHAGGTRQSNVKVALKLFNTTTPSMVELSGLNED